MEPAPTFHVGKLVMELRLKPGDTKPTVWLFFFFTYLFIYLFLAALGLRCCTWAFFSCGELWLLFAAERFLIVVASPVAEHGLQAQASVVVARGSRAQTQQLWRTGLGAPWHVGSSQTRARTASPTLAGGLLTTVPPGKPHCMSQSHAGHLPVPQHRGQTGDGSQWCHCRSHIMSHMRRASQL